MSGLNNLRSDFTPEEKAKAEIASRLSDKVGIDQNDIIKDYSLISKQLGLKGDSVSDLSNLDNIDSDLAERKKKLFVKDEYNFDVTADGVIVAGDQPEWEKPTRDRTPQSSKDRLSGLESDLDEKKFLPEKFKEEFDQKKEEAFRNELFQINEDLNEKKGFFSQFGKDNIPFPIVGMLDEINESYDTYRMVKEFEEGKLDDRGQLKLYRRLAEQGGEKTFGGKVGAIVSESPQFMVDMAMGSGLFNFGRSGTKAVAKKAITKSAYEKLEKRLLTKGLIEVPATLAGTTASIPVAGAGQAVNKYVQNLTPELQPIVQDGSLDYILGESPDSPDALKDAILDTYIEVFSERTGGALGAISKPVTDKLVKTAIGKWMVKLNPAAKSKELKDVMGAVGFNGILGEMFEERVGDVLRAGTGLEEFKIPTAEQLAAEFVAFSIPAGTFKAVDKLFHPKKGLTDIDMAKSRNVFTDEEFEAANERMHGDKEFEGEKLQDLARKAREGDKEARAKLIKAKTIEIGERAPILTDEDLKATEEELTAYVGQISAIEKRRIEDEFEANRGNKSDGQIRKEIEDYETKEVDDKLQRFTPKEDLEKAKEARDSLKDEAINEIKSYIKRLFPNTDFRDKRNEERTLQDDIDELFGNDFERARQYELEVKSTYAQDTGVDISDVTASDIIVRGRSDMDTVQDEADSEVYRIKDIATIYKGADPLVAVEEISEGKFKRDLKTGKLSLDTAKDWIRRIIELSPSKATEWDAIDLDTATEEDVVEWMSSRAVEWFSTKSEKNTKNLPKAIKDYLQDLWNYLTSVVAKGRVLRDLDRRGLLPDGFIDTIDVIYNDKLGEQTDFGGQMDESNGPTYNLKPIKNLEQAEKESFTSRLRNINKSINPEFYADRLIPRVNIPYLDRWGKLRYKRNPEYDKFVEDTAKAEGTEADSKDLLKNFERKVKNGALVFRDTYNDLVQWVSMTYNKSKLIKTLEYGKAVKYNGKVRRLPDIKRTLTDQEFAEKVYAETGIGSIEEANEVLDSLEDFVEGKTKKYERPTRTYNLAVDRTKTDNFQEWFKDSQVLDMVGEPLVVYHGTTHDVESFDTEKGNPENDFGSGIYFSNTPDDVSQNYSKRGNDLDNRIELDADRLAMQMENDPESFDLDENADFQAEAKKIVEKELNGKKDNIIPVYLSIQNPVIVGNNRETFFDYESEFDAETETYSEPTGKLVEFIEAFKEAWYENVEGASPDGIIDTIIENFTDGGIEGGVGAYNLVDTIKNNEDSYDAVNNDDKIVTSEVIRSAFEKMGYDGIIDWAVFDKFSKNEIRGGLEGMGPSTIHYIAFKPEQVKSALGNKGTFDPNDPRMTYSLSLSLNVNLNPDSGKSLTPEEKAYYNALQKKKEEMIREGRDFMTEPEKRDLAVRKQRATDSRIRERKVESLNKKIEKLTMEKVDAVLDKKREQTDIASTIKELEKIVQQLPVELRGRFKGFGRVSARKTTEARNKELSRARERVANIFDKANLQKEKYRIRGIYYKWERKIREAQRTGKPLGLTNGDALKKFIEDNSPLSSKEFDQIHNKLEKLNKEIDDTLINNPNSEELLKMEMERDELIGKLNRGYIFHPNVSLEQLQEFEKNFDSVYFEGITEFEKQQQEEKARIKELADGAVEQINNEDTTESTMEDGGKRPARTGFGYLRRPETSMHTLAKGTPTDQNKLVEGLFDPLFDAEASYLDYNREDREVISEIFDSRKINYNEKFEIVVEKGKEPIEFTMDELMAIYAYSQNDNGLTHLLNTTKQGQQFNLDFIEFVTETVLTQNEKSVVDKIVDYYDTTIFNRLNDVYRESTGISMVKEERYFPIINLDRNRTISDIMQEANVSTGISGGMTKGRVKSEKGFKALSFTQTVGQSVSKTNRYVAYKIPYRKVQRLWNYTDTEKNEKGEVVQTNYTLQKQIEKKSPVIKKALQKWLEQVAQSSIRLEANVFQDVVTKLKNNVYIAVLSSPKVILTQPIAMFSGIGMSANSTKSAGKTGKALFNLPVHGAKALVKLMKTGNHEYATRAWKTANEKSKFMRNRGNNLSIDLMEMAEGNLFNNIIGQSGKWKKVQDFAMFGMKAMDKLISTSVWNAEYEIRMEEHGNEELAIQQADTLVRQTQSTADVVNSAELYRANSIFLRLFTSFTTDINQTVNNTITLKNSDKPALEKYSKALAIAVIIPALYMAILGMTYEEIEEELGLKENRDSKDDFLKTLVSEGIHQTVGWIPMGGTVVEGVYENLVESERAWYANRQGNMVTSLLEDFGTGDPKKTVDAALKARGVPFEFLWEPLITEPLLDD